MTRFLSLFALAAAVPSVASPLDPPVASGAVLHLRCEALDHVTASPTASVACEFDGDGRPDVLSRVGGDLMVTLGPDPREFDAFLGLSGVTAHVPLRVPGERRAGVAATNAQGLMLVERGDPTGTSFAVNHGIAGPAWASARALIAVDLDDDGIDDVAGLDATGTSLLAALRRPGAPWAELAPAPLPAELTGLVPVRWTGQEVMFAGSMAVDGTAGAVLVVDAQGGLVELRSLGGELQDLEPIACGSQPGRLAALVNHQVRVLRAGGVDEAATVLPDVLPTAMSGADYDGDGWDDLVLNSTVIDRVTVLFARPAAATTFDPARLLAIALETNKADMGPQVTAPVPADFDNDGDIDVFQFLDHERDAVLARSALVDETDLHIKVSVFDWILDPVMSTMDLSMLIPSMPDGTDPDALEVTLLSTTGEARLAGAASQLFHELIDTGSAGAGDWLGLTLDFEGEPGSLTALLIRPIGHDGATQEIHRTGPEKVELFWRTVGSGPGVRGHTGGDDPVPMPGEQPGREGAPPTTAPPAGS